MVDEARADDARSNPASSAGGPSRLPRLRPASRILLQIAMAIGGLVGLAMAATPQSAWVGHLPGFMQRPAEPTPKTETAEVRRVRRSRSTVAPKRLRLKSPAPRPPKAPRLVSLLPTPAERVHADPPTARGPPFLAS